MFILDPLTRALFYVFLVGSMLGIGLKVGKDEILSVVRDRSWLVRVFIANFILIPAVGVLAAKAFALKPENALALILLSCAPGGLGALQFLTKTKEERMLAYAGATAFLLSLLSVIISPILISLVLPRGLTINVPYVNAVLYLALFSILPLVLGIAVHDRAAAVARKLGGPVSLIATLAFIVVIVRTRSLSSWAKSGGGPRVLVGVIVLLLVSMLIGWILGGPRTRTRGILATASSMRNVALCVAIAGRSFPDLPVLAPLVVFGAIMAPANLLLMLVLKVAGRKTLKSEPAR
jgi:BASS family bile acid:Na+ symporter